MKTQMMIAAALLLTAGCAVQDTPNGRMLYTENCAVCHGKNADGNGPLAPSLDIWPADLRALAQRNDGVFPADDVLAKVHGYSSQDHFADMPEFGSVFTGPQVMWEAADGARIPTTQNLIVLVKYLESLQVSE